MDSNTVKPFTYFYLAFFAALLFFILVGCFGGVPLPAPTPTATKNAKRTVAVYEFVSRQQWEQTGYYRSGEDALIELPVLIAVANDRTACIIDGRTWANWRDQQVVLCSSAWRQIRP
jgi:hypothetical protein